MQVLVGLIAALNGELLLIRLTSMVYSKASPPMTCIGCVRRSGRPAKMAVSQLAQAVPGSGYATSNAFPGLGFTNPVAIVSAPGETNRLFSRRVRCVMIGLRGGGPPPA